MGMILYFVKWSRMKSGTSISRLCSTMIAATRQPFSSAYDVLNIVGNPLNAHSYCIVCGYPHGKQPLLRLLS